MVQHETQITDVIMKHLNVGIKNPFVTKKIIDENLAHVFENSKYLKRTSNTLVIVCDENCY